MIKFIEVKDHTVSGKLFTVWKCENCSLMFTQDVPSENDMAPYYASESYISHSDTRKGLIYKLYHFVRKHTLQRKRNLVKKESGTQRGKILDIGCGTAAFLNTMQQQGWGVTGVEPDSSARQKAVSLYSIHPLPAEELISLPDENYNVISLWHVLEHVHDLHGYIEKIKSLLIKNGKIFIAVPNYTSYDAGKYGANWAAYDVPRHLYHFSPESMQYLITLHGMRVTKILPMWYDAFYVSMLSEKYKTGRSNLPTAFLNGLLSNARSMRKKEKCSSLIYVIEK